MSAVDNTVYQNMVQAINTLAQTYLNVQGALTVTNLTTATVVRKGAGRMCTISIITAGSASGTIYDANSTAITTAPIFTIPMTAAVIVINLPVTNGIVVSPGTGQVVTVSYS